MTTKERIIWAVLCSGVVIFIWTLFGIRMASAQTVTDGDTLKINGTTWRLFGVDAPETKQWCGPYPAGIQATALLEHLIKGKAVTCELKDHDRYGRSVGICWAAGEDLGKTMVRLGMAWAFTRYSTRYVGEENAARQERLGVHAYACEFPWDWRREHKR